MLLISVGGAGRGDVSDRFGVDALNAGDDTLERSDTKTVYSFCRIPCSTNRPASKHHKISTSTMAAEQAFSLRTTHHSATVPCRHLRRPLWRFVRPVEPRSQMEQAVQSVPEALWRPSRPAADLPTMWPEHWPM